MTLPELNVIDLPDLTQSPYPAVGFGVSCAGAGPIADKACWPPGFELQRVKPYALPTTPLGELQQQLIRMRNLFPIPPSLGVHCATISLYEGQINVVPPGDEGWQRDVLQPSEDSCQIGLADILSIPCSIPDFDDGEVTVGNDPTAVGTTSVTATGSGCNQTFSVQINLDSLNITAEPTTGARVQIDNAGDPGAVANDWDHLACRSFSDLSGCVHLPGDEVALAIDLEGMLVVQGETLGSASTDNPEIVVFNRSGRRLYCGDKVELQKLVDQTGAPPGTTYWGAYV